jgi:hypothetical protein
MAELSYGIDKELKEKQMAKYDHEMEKKVVEWIEVITGERKADQDFGDWLKNGQILCHLVNVIQPGAVKKVNTSAMPFKQMENITYYTDWARKVGVPESAMFATPDLYEAKNLGSVVSSIYMLGGVVQVVFPGLQAKLGVPMNTGSADTKRMGRCVDQSGGFAKTMEVEKPKDQRGIVQGQAGLKPPEAGGIGGSANNSPRSMGDITRGYHTAGAAPPPSVTPAGGYASIRPAVAAPVEDVTYGIDKELKDKQAAKYDVGLEKEVSRWIESVTGESRGDASMHDWLKSGVVLCNLANQVKPGSVAKINSSTMPFKQMENIKYFMDFARCVGVPESSMFGTPDLFEDKNIGSVVSCINTLGGAIQVNVPEYKGPKLGVALNTASTDKKRGGGLCTDMSAGFNATLEVQRPTERADYCVKPVHRIGSK